MGPAAILSILVRAQGVETTQAQLTALNASAEKAAVGMTATETAARGAGAAHLKAAKAVAGFVGAYASIHALKESVDTTEELGHTVVILSKNFGLATKQAAEWAAVSKARNLNSVQLTMSFKALSLAIRNAQGGSKTQVKAFRELGISQADLKRHGNDLNAVLGMVSDGLKAMPAGTNRAAIQSQLFGRTWQKLGPLLRGGSAAMREQLQAADKYGATLGEKGVTSVEEFIKAQREARLASIGLQVTMGTTLIPVITKVTAAAAQFVRQFREGTGSAGQLRHGIDSILKALSPFGESIKQIVGWLQQHNGAARILIPTLGGLAIAIWAVNAALNANPFILAAEALAALTIGIVTAYRESATFRDVVNAVFNAVAPVVTTAVNAIIAALNAIAPTFASVTSAVGGAMSAIVGAVGGIGPAFANARAAVSGAMNAISAEIGQWTVGAAVVRTAIAAMTALVRPGFTAMAAIVRSQMAVIGDVIRAAWGVIQAVFAGAFIALRGIVQGGVNTLRGIVLVFGGVLKGDFGQMWDGVKLMFRGAGQALAAILRGEITTIVGAVRAIAAGMKAAFSDAITGILAAMRSAGGVLASGAAAMGRVLVGGFAKALNLAHELAVAMRDLIAKAPGYALGVGQAIVRGIIAGIKSVAGNIGSAIGGAIKSVDPTGLARKIGDGVGRSVPPAAGKGSAALKGANSSLSGFARLGASFGLSVSSGRRPGAITSSGNVSYHSTGEAIDMSNGYNTPQEMAFFKYMKSHYGSQLAELIFTPGGVGIKNGRPFTYTGQVAADHYDHVHVAFDTGKPGVGDGFGKMAGARRALGTGDGTGNVATAWKFLLAKGFTPAQAAGIIGFMQGESGQGLSTTALNPKSGAYGIAQWLGGRKSALMGKDNPSSIATQLNYLWSELQGPEAAAFKQIKAAHSVPAAAAAWAAFERPGPGELHLSARIGNARNVFNSMKGVGAGSLPTDGGGGGGTDVATLKRTLQKNLDMIDALRTKLRNLPSGNASAAKRKQLQNQIAALQTRNRHIRDAIAAAPKAQKQAEPLPTDFEQGQAFTALYAAQAAGTPGTADDVTAITAQDSVVQARIAKIKQALKKKNLTLNTRVRLQGELAQRLGEHQGFQQSLQDIRDNAPDPLSQRIEALGKFAAGADAHLAVAQTTDTLADDLGPLQEKVSVLGQTFEAVQQKFGAGSLEAQQAFADLTQATATLAKTQRDAIVQGFEQQLTAGQAFLTAAKVLTPDNLGDDMQALQGSLAVATTAFTDAMARGDTEAIVSFGNEVLGLRDSIKQLGADVEANTAAQRDMERQLKEQAQRAVQIGGIEREQLLAAIADLISGQIAGPSGYAGRALTAGAGSSVRY